MDKTRLRHPRRNRHQRLFSFCSSSAERAIAALEKLLLSIQGATDGKIGLILARIWRPRSGFVARGE